MKLAYRAATKDGKILRGEIDAKDMSEAASFLRNQQLLPIHIKPKIHKSLLTSLPFIGKSNTKDLIFFTRQIASMLSAGLNLMQTLNILKDQIQNPIMSDIVQGIIGHIEEGESFSKALAKYPEIFSPIYISLIKAAETSGLLDKIMLRLADNLEKQQKLKETIKSALMYPSIVIMGMVGVMFIMMIFVIPQLTTLYQSLNVALPLSTKIVVGMSNFITTFWPLAIGMAILTVFLFKRWQKTQSGELVLDKLALRMPIFGKLMKETILTEFTRTLGLLIGAGSLVVESLQQTADVSGNIHYKNAILGVSKRVERGISIGDAMKAFPLFPPMVVEMVKIGEQTGKLDDSLSKLSEYYEREVDQTVKTLTTAMEPIIMVFLGAGVAFLIFSVITPIYKITSSF